MRILLCDDDITVIEQLRDSICEFFRKNESIMPEIAAYDSGYVEAYLTRRKYREFRDTYLTFMESVR